MSNATALVEIVRTLDSNGGKWEGWNEQRGILSLAGPYSPPLHDGPYGPAKGQIANIDLQMAWMSPVIHFRLYEDGTVEVRDHMHHLVAAEWAEAYCEQARNIIEG